MNLRGAKPVVDYYFKHYISNLDCSSELYNDSLPQEFTENFYNWINSSTLNNLQGLDLFPSKRLVCGTAQAFDHFYLKHKAKRFRFYKGEFMYHSACLKHGFDWAYIEDGRLQITMLLLLVFRLAMQVCNYQWRTFYIIVLEWIYLYY